MRQRGKSDLYWSQCIHISIELELHTPNPYPHTGSYQPRNSEPPLADGAAALASAALAVSLGKHTTAGMPQLTSTAAMAANAATGESVSTPKKKKK